MSDLFSRAGQFSARCAIIDQRERYTYNDLLSHSSQLADQLLNGRDSLNEARVAYLIDPGFDYVVVQWAIWQAGGIAVPLCTKHPRPALEYVITDSQATQVLVGNKYRPTIKKIADSHGLELINYIRPDRGEINPRFIDPSCRAMILYTSGTTGSPKGVVTTHGNIHAQVKTLVEAWHWSQEDHILNVLPLHHVHGIINILTCALWSGATCEFISEFSPELVFDSFQRKEINVFMAVPTIYYKLIKYFESLNTDEKESIIATLKSFRLMVSGSAALPVSTLEKWKKISGHTLLERYGMTEIGMAISNPYEGKRIPGRIGQALPETQIRLRNGNDDVELNETGEIQVKGPSVFKEYWNKPEATINGFTVDKWFKTGDIASWDGYSYKIHGRDSVDIIKSGGYKISALEIEDVLLTHPEIKECAVIGIADDEWGEIIACGLVANKAIEKNELIDWLKERLPGYKVPRIYKYINSLPRNAMGKVTKPKLKELFA